MLQLYHAHLNVFADFLHTFIHDYATPHLAAVDPQKVEMRRWTLKVIVADSQLYRQLANAGNQIAATVESLLEVVLARENDPGHHRPQPNHADLPNRRSQLAVLSAEIRGCAREVTARLAAMSGSQDHSVQLLNLSRDMNQSGDVKTLTILATIFLPLSLSAGVLSMQSRFRDLGGLLYDFFGVVVILAAVVLLLILVMFVFSSLREYESRLWIVP